jgi:hypothetical protein
MGKLHSFDIKNAPVKTGNGPGQGHGPVGDVKQGSTGEPWLSRVNVYQGKDANGKAKRGIFTFRTASSKQVGQQKWDHPGNAGVNILDDAAKWAQDTFEKDIAPGLLAKIVMGLGD